MIKIKKYQIENYISDATQSALDLKADLVNGKVPASQLPSFVDDVIEVANYAALPIPGATGVIYITLDTNKVYRWTGSVYVEIASGSTNLSYTAGVSDGTVNSDTGTDATIPLADTTNAGLFSAAEKTKLAGIATGANVGVVPNAPITGATKTKITYDSKGLVTAGADATTADIADSTNKRYVTDANLVVIGNTSGTNTGDQGLQSVTDIDAITDNTITINTVNADGLNINTSGGDTTKSPLVITSTISNATTFKSLSYNGVLGNYFYSDTGDCISLQTDDPFGIGLNVASTGLGISAYSIGFPVMELFQALNNKGLIINSGTSSTGNFIELKKNGVDKFTINQQGEQSIVKIPGGTSSQILAADGSVIIAGNNITISGGTISSVGGSGGGGSTVNYYLNGGTSQGTFGGTTYYEFSRTAILGTGADFTRNTNGYIASFITDVADPSLLLIPAGNWNLEFYFSSSSAGGSPSFYTELYKYNGTTFTLIASDSATPKGITNGTTIDAYFTTLAVPETVLTVNDRLAIRVYVNASGRTITLHTQNGHLCEVITTFTNGLTALNGLQAQVQNFAVGTTGTDFSISSSGSTHTFNLPNANVTARGVVSTGTQTFAGAKTFSSISFGGTGAPTFFEYSGIPFLTVGTGGTFFIGGGPGAAQNNLAVPNGTFNIGLQTASTIASFDANKNIVSLTVANGYPTLEELKWLSGVTSSIQTQLNTKGSGTVTSVAALTLGTSGTDLNSSVSNGSSTPVITLNVPDANETARGVITTGAQTIAGVKTFSSSPISVTPTASSNDTKVATTQYVDRQVTTGANILITTSSNITTDTLGSSGGVNYSQNGRNVMINNGATAITLTMFNTSTPTDFIASYTKIGTATITFTFSALGIIFPNGNLLSGGPGSTALLMRNGSTAYLLINNV